MRRFPTRSRFTTLPLFLVLIFILTSCSSWRELEPISVATIQKGQYTQLRVRQIDGSVDLLRDPWFGGDTLYGHSANVGSGSSAMGDSVAIPLARISTVESRHFSGVKTAFLVVGVGAAAIVVGSVIACADGTCLGLGDNCPLIYSWDGTAWRLDSGTYAGAIMPALARTDVDNLEFATSQDGILQLHVTGVPNETDHVDAIRIVAVDHDPQCTIAPDAAGMLHALGSLTPPATAQDFRQRDVLDLVRADDAMNWQSVPTVRDTVRAEDIRDGIEIEFPKAAGAIEARLVVDARYTLWKNYLMGEFIQLHGRDTGAWYRALSADPAQAQELQDAVTREMYLGVSTWDGERWKPQGVVPGVGPELAKRQVVVLDLSGVQGETVRVRLESAPSLWLIDRVAVDFGPEREFTAKEIGPSEARDSRGHDVRARLDRADGQIQVMESSDSLDLRFAVDPTPPGRARSYLAATTGWYRLDMPESAKPDEALADRLVREPLAMSRFSVSLLNQALQSMATAGHGTP